MKKQNILIIIGIAVVVLVVGLVLLSGKKIVGNKEIGYVQQRRLLGCGATHQIRELSTQRQVSGGVAGWQSDHHAYFRIPQHQESSLQGACELVSDGWWCVMGFLPRGHPRGADSW